MNIQNFPNGWDQEPGKRPYPWSDTGLPHSHFIDTTSYKETFDQHRDSTIVSLFERQVRNHPSRSALEHNGKSTTYHDLNERAGRLAGHLATQYGVKPGTRVGIMLDRSE